MDFQQDLAVNSLNVLNKMCATDFNNACAVFEGGISIKKNIIAKEIETDMIETKNLKISDDMSVQRDLYVEGTILPFSPYSTGSIGTNINKWNELHVINANIQNLDTNNATIGNVFLENISLKACRTNITDISTSTITYNIFLDSAINVINMISAHNHDIIINIPEPEFNTEFSVKKIIFTQNKYNKIKWLYGNNGSLFKIMDSLDQTFELVNINNSWIFNNYSSIDNRNHIDILEDISSIRIMQNVQDISLNDLQIQLDVLVNFNNFLSIADPSANSILDFMNENSQIKQDVDTLQASLLTMDNTLTCINALLNSTTVDLASFKTSLGSKIIDISSSTFDTITTIDLFKNVVNSTFSNINSQMLLYDSKITNVALKSSEIARDIHRTKELIDIVDKRLSDHICNTESKFKYMNDKMNHMNEKLNVVFSKIGMCN